MSRHVPARSPLFASCVFGVVCTLLASSPAEAQSPPAAPEKFAIGDWQLSPSLEIRARGEYRHDPPDMGGLDFFGRVGPRVRDSWVVFERSRLGLGAERGALKAQFTLQDARAFGSSSPIAAFGGSPGIGQIAPYEAFVEVRSSGANPSYARLGRQAVVWGEGRLIGNADFSPVGRSLDAFRAHVAAGRLDVEALAAILETPSPLGAAFGDTRGPSRSGIQLYGLMGRFTIDPLLRVEAFAFARISRSGGAVLDGSRFAASRLSGDLFTGALRVSGDSKGWEYGAEGAYQFGTTDALALGGKDVRAYAATAHVAKTVPELALTPTFRVAGSYASGDDGGGKYGQFDPLLPDPQRFHGQMDLFAWSNMADVSGRAQIVPWTDTVFSVEYRYARLAQASGEWIGSYLTAIGRADPTPAFIVGTPVGPTPTATELGHEVDAAFAWRPWVPLELRAGYSALFLGDAAKAIMASHQRGSPSLSHYGFAQATLSVP